jgi:hypothetical protein
VLDIDLPRLPPERIGDFHRLDEAFNELLDRLGLYSGPELQQRVHARTRVRSGDPDVPALLLDQAAEAERLFVDIGQAKLHIHAALQAVLAGKDLRALVLCEMRGVAGDTARKLLFWCASTPDDVEVARREGGYTAEHVEAILQARGGLVLEGAYWRMLGKCIRQFKEDLLAALRPEGDLRPPHPTAEYCLLSNLRVRWDGETGLSLLLCEVLTSLLHLA